jgi:Na+-transporting NADH:ubiquinone oxidoreductase subunit A
MLLYDKRNEKLKFRAPAGGRIDAIKVGPRRVVTEISIEISENEEMEEFKRYSAEQILALPREEVLGQLLETGYLAYLLQRPFSKIADTLVLPKSIFVNGMNTAPFQADIHIAVTGSEAAFQAGLNVLTRLTHGQVHLCLGVPPIHASPAVLKATAVELHRFLGPHPAGNSSVHIHHVDPIAPGDQVWAIRAVDVIQIGKLFLDGVLPATKVIAVGGTGIRESRRQYYEIRVGGELDSVLGEGLADDSVRIVGGDVLSGIPIRNAERLRFYNSSIVVIPEGRERRFLGWLGSGWGQYSASRLFLSSWFRRAESWGLDTNLNGSHRAMVMTGIYDKYVPMRIMVDYLVRAALAHDTDETVKLGILETDPEDFALCSYACPSKMDIMGIIRNGLLEVEEEGL